MIWIEDPLSFLVIITNNPVYDKPGRKKGYRQKYGINSFCLINLELEMDLLVKKNIEKNRRGRRKKKKGVVKTGFIDNKNSLYVTTDQKDLQSKCTPCQAVRRWSLI